MKKLIETLFRFIDVTHEWVDVIASYIDRPFFVVIKKGSRFVERVTGRDNFVQAVDVACILLGCGVYGILNKHQLWFMPFIFTAFIFIMAWFAKIVKERFNSSFEGTFCLHRLLFVFIVALLIKKILFNNDNETGLYFELTCNTLVTLGFYLVACASTDPPKKRKRRRILESVHQWLRDAMASPQPQSI